MSLKLVLVAYLVGVAFSPVLGDYEGESGRHGESSNGDSYKWWEPSEYYGYLNNLQQLEEKMDSCTLAAKMFSDIEDKEQRSKNYEDALVAVIQLGLVSGQILDKSYPGLGKIYSDMLTAHVRVQHCLYKPTSLSSLMGTKKPALCSANYGESWGCSHYNGTFDSAAEIIKGHNLVNTHKQVTELISKYSKGKGISGIDEQYREIIRALEDYSKRFDKLYSSCSRDENDFIGMLLDSLTINGGLANNLQPNYGDEIVDCYLRFFSWNFNSIGLPDIAAVESEAKKNIKKCGPVSWKEDY